MIRIENTLFKRFIRLINEHYEILNDEETQVIKDIVHIRKYSKNEIIINEGALVPKLCFLLDGCVRLFYNHSGQDRTTFFYTEGDFLWRGRNKRLQNLLNGNYQCIEDANVVVFDLEKLNQAFDKYPKLLRISRIWIDYELMKCQEMITTFVTLSPENRYIELMNSNNKLFQKVPQKYIASYIGISAETLSRIKTRVFRKIRESRQVNINAIAS